MHKLKRISKKKRGLLNDKILSLVPRLVSSLVSSQTTRRVGVVWSVETQTMGKSKIHPAGIIVSHLRRNSIRMMAIGGNMKLIEPIRTYMTVQLGCGVDSLTLF